MLVVVFTTTTTTTLTRTYTIDDIFTSRASNKKLLDPIGQLVCSYKGRSVVGESEIERFDQRKASFVQKSAPRCVLLRGIYLALAGLLSSARSLSLSP